MIVATIGYWVNYSLTLLQTLKTFPYTISQAMTDKYLSLAFNDLKNNDGLLVMARGIGLRSVFVKYLRDYCFQENQTSRESNQKGIVFVINLLESGKHDDSSGFSMENVNNALLNEGIMPFHLPKIINNEIPTQERVEMYTSALHGRESKVFIITSRILIVDMLDNKIHPLNIKGFFVPNAHKLNEYSIEAFILRVYREHNHSGFIKAFSEDPETLITTSSGSQKIIQVLKLLQLRKLYLYPRNHPAVAEAITPSADSGPHQQLDVIEMGISLTTLMKAIQAAILAAIRVCITELKKSTTNIGILDDVLNIDNGQVFSAGLDRMIRKMLDSDWHRLSYRTKALLSDLADLRKLLEYLLRYDAFSFYYFLLKLKKASIDSTNAKSSSSPSLWLLSEAADHIFNKAKDHVYRILTKEQYQKRLSQASSSNPVPNISYPEPLSIGHVLFPVLEVPPKWRALKQIMNEINQSRAEAEARSKTKKKHRVIIIVRDELTQSQLNDYLTYDETMVMDQRYRWFISQQVAEIKQQLTSARNSNKRQRTGSSVPQPPPNLEATAAEDEASYLGLGVNQRQFDCLSIEDKLLLLEEQRLHNMLSAKRMESNISSETSALEASISNGIMTAPADDIDDEDDDEDNDFEEKQASASKGNKRKAAASESSATMPSSKIKNLGTRKATSSQKANASTIRPQAASSSEVFDGDYAGYPFDWIKSSRPDTSAASASASASIPDQKTWSLLQSASMVIFVTHAEALSSYFNILEELQPNHVIMYDGDITLIRMIETYHTNLIAQQQQQQGMDQHAASGITVYYTYYDESAEKHRYVDSLTREKRAFESLSSLISSGIISSIALPDSLADLNAARAEDQSIVRDSRLIQREFDFRTNTAATSSTSSSSSATAGATTAAKSKNNPLAMIRREVKTGASASASTDNDAGTGPSKPVVVVDIREFRSALPSLLHAAGYHILPRTLIVGDYVLAAEIVVERKGISDLSQSFNSGRLYNQVEAMSKYYKYPCLLIEFSPDKVFALQSAADISSDIQASNITTKLSILALTFPNLRILWSRSPHETGNIFAALVQGHEPVDIVKALNAGSLEAADPSSAEATSTSNQVDILASETRLTAQEMLLSLPGVNVHNFRIIMSSVTSLHELSRMDEADLAALIGSVNAKKLYVFFKQRIAL